MKFFVGCRVRLIHPVEIKNYGKEGFFAGWQDTPKGTVFSNFPGAVQDFNANCLVVWDCDPDCDACQHTDQLEVVVPDDAKSRTLKQLESLQELLVCED